VLPVLPVLAVPRCRSALTVPAVFACQALLRAAGPPCVHRRPPDNPLSPRHPGSLRRPRRPRRLHRLPLPRARTSPRFASTRSRAAWTSIAWS